MSTQTIPIPKKQNISSLTVAFSTGLALFSMFFGAGNLIFPLILGRLSGSEIPYATIGLGISAVAFPLLGLLAMMFFGGNIHAFLGRLGKWPALVLLFVLQICMGPLSTMPRLVTVMFPSIQPYFPQLSLLLFSILICSVIFLATIRPNKIVNLLGVVLTPLFLLILGSLVIAGLIDAPSVQPVAETSLYCFGQGIKLGYQTMDLICALLFSTIVLPHLSQGTEGLSSQEKQRLVRRRMVLASLVAAGLLMICYVGLCLVSAHHSWTLPKELPPEALLQAIALKILGPTGGMIAAATVLLACITTAMSLAAVFSQYLKNDLLPNLLPASFNRQKGIALPLAITMLATGAVANLGFSGIVRFTGPLLDILYPALIVLCLFNIAHSLYHIKPIKLPVFLTVVIALGGFCFG